MRIALLTLACLLAGSALADEPYDPPAVYVTKPGVTDQSVATAAYLKAKATCLAAETDPTDRDRYYVRCMKDELGKDGFVVMTEKEYRAATGTGA